MAQRQTVPSGNGTGTHEVVLGEGVTPREVTLGDPYERVVVTGYYDRAHTGPVEDATLQELIGRIINDVSELLDKQVQLAKQEVKEDLHEAIGKIKQIAIGGGIMAGVGLLLLIWAWTAFIWFFNWLGDFIGISMLGWIVGLIVPLVIAFAAWKAFIQPGLALFKLRPLERTRATLKEDLEWVQHLRTPSTR